MIYAEQKEESFIREVQLFLSLKGYYNGPLDGIAGSRTKKAVRLFKQKIGFPDTDQISDELAQKLRDEFLSVSMDVDSPIKKNGNVEKKQEQGERQETIESLTSNLNETKKELQRAKNALKRLNDNFSDHFISNFRELVSIGGSALGIALALFGGVLVYGVPRYI